MQKIYLSPPNLMGNEQDALQSVFRSSWVAPQGPMLADFENKLAQFVNTPYAVALNSATSAIHLGLQLLGVGKGDKVLCASFTFVASVNPVCYVGAIPILIDAELDTWNICPILLEKAILSEIEKGTKPKALILVHGYGMPAKVDEILDIAKKYDIKVLEDAASALGSVYKGKHCGTFGEIGVFSFNGNKIITTSGGGMLVAHQKKHATKALYMATQAKEETPDYQHNQIGYNYRLSNVLAAIGVSQLALLPDFIKKRKANFEFYKEALKSHHLKFLEPNKQVGSNHWLTCVLFESFKKREQIRLALASENIESRPLWKPMHQQSIYKNTSFYDNGVSDDLHQRGLCLPSGSCLLESDLLRIVKIIKINL